MAIAPRSKQLQKDDGTWSRRAPFRIIGESIPFEVIFHYQCGKNDILFENSNTGVFKATCKNCGTVKFVPKTLDTKKRCSVWNRDFYRIEKFVPSEKHMEPIDRIVTIDNGKCLYDSFVELKGPALMDYYKKFFEEGKIFTINSKTGFYEISEPEE